ncbi:MAG: glutamate--tRNA ligase [Promethearchaeota archaeon]
MSENDDITTLIKKITLVNAIKYKGKAKVGSVMNTIMGKHPEFRSRAREIKNLVQDKVDEINKMSLEEIENALVSLGFSKESLNAKKKEEKTLPKLPGLDENIKPTFRLAPYPSGPLHIGNARMIILNDEYAKLTGGKLILCFDDTIGSSKKKREEKDSDAKFVIPEAYEMIRNGLKWLGVTWHEEVYKSDRLDIYYEYCEKLISKNQAYACTCDMAVFKGFKDDKNPCPHREPNPDESVDDHIKRNLKIWKGMMNGEFEEGSVVIRLKTGMDLRDPALRDPVIMRISNAEHPRVGNKYKAWPMLEFSWAIDDHLLGITHIIRGKDLFKEDFVENFIWDIFKWKKPWILHYGIIRTGFKLSKTKARKLIEKEVYFGWDDPRTWSLQSLKRRGIQPRALRKTLLDMGLSMTDIDFPYSILYSENQKLIDPIANRYFFVDDPVKIEIQGIKEDKIVAEPLINPLNEALGRRKITININNNKKTLFITRMDSKSIIKDEHSRIVRLKDFFNIKIESHENGGAIIKATYHSKDLETARNNKAKIIHWVDTEEDNIVKVEIIMDNGTIVQGFGEKNLENTKPDQIVQFERFGFVRIDKIKKDQLRAFLTHETRKISENK